ncbi:hypothetical protein L208DRAFT_62124 [Tricholoma matsutake]|nr:hypothetical protein L208DRAFT_62124 [Tricholoma matsutake 945]
MQNAGEGAAWWCLIVVWVHGSCSLSSSPSLSLSPSPHCPHPNGSPFLPHEQLLAVADWGAAVVVAIIAIPSTIHPTSSGSWGWRRVVSLAPSSLSVMVGSCALHSGGSGAGRWWHCHCHQLHTHNPPYEQRLTGMGWVCWVVSCPAIITSRVEPIKQKKQVS